MDKGNGDGVGLSRRTIFKGIAGGGLLSTLPLKVDAAEIQTKPEPAASSAAGAAASTEEVAVPAELTALEGDARPGSDHLVDVLKSLDLQYVAANPGSSFRAIHESLVNYGGNKSPELLTCLHEESAVSIAHGYARASGRPMAVMMHATVGLQHGSMAIYNAFCDRVPILMLSANTSDGTQRRPFIEWVHTAQDAAAIVRDFTKWDDQPGSLPHLSESIVRGYKLSTAQPQGPVLIVADADVQEHPITPGAEPKVPKFAPNVPPVADSGALDQLAKLLLTAENPVILADRYARSESGIAALVQLAELVGAAVCDLGARFNFPNTHPLNHSQRARAVVGSADVVLALEPVDLWGALARLIDQSEKTERPVVPADAKIATIALDNVILRSNFQDFNRYRSVDLAITGDAEASLQNLVERVGKLRTSSQRSKVAERASNLGDIHQATRARDREAAAVGWNASPISTARLCMELWNVIKDEDWALASPTFTVSNWPQRLWSMTKPQHYTGAIGAGGIGSFLPIAVGAALAHRDKGRVTVNIQTDGDLMYAPGALWTAAHHGIPLLSVMHNNRAYHQEIMHIQRMAARNERGLDRVHIGNAITNPNIDFAALARSMGVWAAGPITEPGDLNGAFVQALAAVKRGQPALVDVITQPR